MFHADITFVLALIALAAGALLVISSKTRSDVMTVICKIIGFVVIVIAALAILFAGHIIIRSHLIKHVMMYNIIHKRKMMPGMMHHRMMKPRMRKKMQSKKPM